MGTFMALISNLVVFFLYSCVLSPHHDAVSYSYIFKEIKDIVWWQAQVQLLMLVSSH